MNYLKKKGRTYSRSSAAPGGGGSTTSAAQCSLSSNLFVQLKSCNVNLLEERVFSSNHSTKMKSSILFFSFLVCLLPSFTLAFSDSTPLLGFASQLNHFLDSSIPNLLSSSTKSPVSYSNEISNALKGSSKKGLCEIDAVAIFQVQGVSRVHLIALFLSVIT